MKRPASESNQPASQEEAADESPRDLISSQGPTAKDILAELPQDLVTILSRCYVSSPDIIPLVLSSLPLGSRALVLAYGIAYKGPDGRFLPTSVGRQCMRLSSQTVDSSEWDYKVKLVEADGQVWHESIVIPELERGRNSE